MTKKGLLAIVLIIAGAALCGCGYSALERQTFSICLSVDSTDDGRIKLGLQSPKNGKSTDTGSSDYEVFSATGDTLADALRIMAATTPYPVNFSQLRLCYIRYEYAAKTEMRSVLRYLLELPSMRPDATVMIVLGDAFEAMQAQRPEFGMRMSTHLDILLSRMRDEQLMPNSSLSMCTRLIGSGFGDPLLCVCAVNPTLEPRTQNSEQKSDGSGGDGSGGGESGSAPAYAQGEPWSEHLLPDDLIAGMLPRTSGNPVEFLGSAAMSDGRVAGLLSVRQTQLVLRAAAEAQKFVQIQPDKPVLRLILKQGSVLDAASDELAQAMRLLQELDSDALLFGQTAMREFTYDRDWNSYAFADRYKNAEIAVGSR